MIQDKLPPTPGPQQEKSTTGPTNVGGMPPTQPQMPQPPDPAEKHPVADSKADVSHGPFVPGSTDKQADVKGGLPSREARVREDDRGPVGVPRPALRHEGNNIRFDWYPQSVSQVVTLHRGKKAFIESIVANVHSCGSDPGPTSLTFRKVPAGDALTTGKALHTGSIDLIGPVNRDIAGVEQVMAMVHEKADRTLEEGDCIAADFSGAMKNAKGTVKIKLSDVKEDKHESK